MSGEKEDTIELPIEVKKSLYENIKRTVARKLHRAHNYRKLFIILLLVVLVILLGFLICRKMKTPKHNITLDMPLMHINDTVIPKEIFLFDNVSGLIR